MCKETLRKPSKAFSFLQGAVKKANFISIISIYNFSSIWDLQEILFQVLKKSVVKLI